jgi:hypothetical protein
LTKLEWKNVIYRCKNTQPVYIGTYIRVYIQARPLQLVIVMDTSKSKLSDSIIRTKRVRTHRKLPRRVFYFSWRSLSFSWTVILWLAPRLTSQYPRYMHKLIWLGSIGLPTFRLMTFCLLTFQLPTILSIWHFVYQHLVYRHFMYWRFLPCWPNQLNLLSSPIKLTLPS